MLKFNLLYIREFLWKIIAQKNFFFNNFTLFFDDHFRNDTTNDYNHGSMLENLGHR